MAFEFKTAGCARKICQGSGGCRRLDLNVLAVEHHREGLALGLEEAALTVTVETRDPEHGRQVVESLEVAGYSATPRLG